MRILGKACKGKPSNSRIQDPRISSYNGYYIQYKNDWRKRKEKHQREFSITLDEFIEIVSQNCHYCGKPPRKYNWYYKSDGSFKNIVEEKDLDKDYINKATVFINGIDRKDNSIGYVKTNCLPCCTICNLGKRSLNYNEFIEHLINLKNTQQVWETENTIKWAKALRKDVILI